MKMQSQSLAVRLTCVVIGIVLSLETLFAACEKCILNNYILLLDPDTGKVYNCGNIPQCKPTTDTVRCIPGTSASNYTCTASDGTTIVRPYTACLQTDDGCVITQ